MTLADWLILLAVLVFLLMSFFFSGSETALMASSRGSMLRLAKGGSPNASIVTQLLENRERLLGAVLIGNNLATIVSSSLATDLLHAWFGEIGVVYASIVMTVLIILFCEMLPKTAAINAPDRYALSVAPAMRTVVRVFGPVLTGADWLVRRMLTLFGVKSGQGEPLLSAYERLRGAVDLFHREGSVEKHDRDMLGGLLDLRDLTVADVMIHRTEVITADVGEPPEQVVEVVLKELVTRVPLWRGTPENIVGILHVKDLLRAIQAAGGDPKKIDIMAIARPAWFVPEIRPLTEQLKAFRRRRTPLAIVVDEYGEFMGIVTLEDILEEIVGDISDEHDVEVPGVRPQPDGSVNVDGAVPIRDLNRAMDWNLPDDEATTIAGLVIHEARSIPEPGQSFTFHGFRFQVLRRNRNRLEALRITPVVQKAAAKAG
jgi:magnesium and cobalt exporter, CNNM family